MIVPKIFHKIPASLAEVDPPASPDELASALKTRRRFLFPRHDEPYMVDVVRAFRLAKGKQYYAEIGTRDRGNLAVAARLMGRNPTIVDVDLERFPANERLIEEELKDRANYTFIQGDSASPKTVQQVASAIGPQGADIIFCDSSHMYEHTLAEFDYYYDLVRPGGFLFFHDAMWEGNETDKGKHQALLQIDRVIPVYVVMMDEPVHRILPRSTKGDTWGCVAIIPKEH